MKAISWIFSLFFIMSKFIKVNYLKVFLRELLLEFIMQNFYFLLTKLILWFEHRVDEHYSIYIVCKGLYLVTRRIRFISIFLLIFLSSYNHMLYDNFYNNLLINLNNLIQNKETNYSICSIKFETKKSETPERIDRNVFLN